MHVLAISYAAGTRSTLREGKAAVHTHLTSVQCANGSTAIGHQWFQNTVGDFIIGAVVCLSIVWEAIFSAFRLRFLDSLDYTRSVELLLLFGLRVLRRSRNLFSAKKCFIYVGIGPPVLGPVTPRQIPSSRDLQASFLATGHRAATDDRFVLCLQISRQFRGLQQDRSNLAVPQPSSARPRTLAGPAAGSWFACSYCSRWFTTKYHVARHERTHSGEKPYSCIICHRAFSDESSCKRHALRCTIDACQPLSATKTLLQNQTHRK